MLNESIIITGKKVDRVDSCRYCMVPCVHKTRPSCGVNYPLRDSLASARIVFRVKRTTGIFGPMMDEFDE